MKDPLKGVVIWPVPENKDISVTLFKDPRSHELEDKEWTFIIEDVSLFSCFRILPQYMYSSNSDCMLELF